MGARDVADVVHLEGENRSETSGFHRRLRPLETLAPQAGKINIGFPIGPHRSPCRSGVWSVVFHVLISPKENFELSISNFEF
jgi:hypothetical protein